MLYEIFAHNGGRLAAFSAAALVCAGVAPTAALLFAGAALLQAPALLLEWRG